MERRQLLSVMIATLLIFSGLPVAFGAEIGAQIDQKIIVVSNNAADHAAAKALAKVTKAKIVVTPWGTYNETIINEILAEEPNIVIIIGGPVAVPSAIEWKLEKENIPVKRLGGEDRYETASKVAHEGWGRKGIEKAVIADGYDDKGIDEAVKNALSEGIPVFFIKPDKVPEHVKTHLKELGVRSAVIIAPPNMKRAKIKVETEEAEVEVKIRAAPLKERAAEQIAEAIEEISEAEEAINKTEHPRITAAEKLLEIARSHLEKADDAFDAESYGEAFGMATSARVLAENAKRIAEGVVVGKLREHVTERAREKIAEASEEITELEEEIAEFPVEINTTRPEQFLEKAREALESAEQAIIEGESEKAIFLAVKAKRLAKIGLKIAEKTLEAAEEARETGEEIAEEMLDAQEEILELQRLIMECRMRDINVTDVETFFDQAKAKLQAARESVNRGNVTAATSLVEEAIELAESGHDLAEEALEMAEEKGRRRGPP